MSYVRPLSGFMLTTAEIHSRTSPRQQSQLEISSDNNNFYSKPTMPMHDSYSQDNFVISRRGSHTLANEPIFIGRNELEQMRRHHGNTINPYEFETHSLPRRTCIHHKQEEYHTHSLPRREHHHHYLEHSANTSNSNNNNNINNNNVTVEQILEKRRLSSASLLQIQQQQHQDIQHSYVNVNAVGDTYSLSRRSSSSHQHQLQQQQQQQVPSLVINSSSIQHHQQLQHQHQQKSHHHQALQQVPPNDEMCSTCSSETESQSESEGDEDDDGCDDDENEQDENEHGDSHEDEESESVGGVEEDDNEDLEDEEKEIFIDFKPNVSKNISNVTSSKEELATKKKKKKFIKAMSVGEMLIDNNEKDKQKLISASDDDLQQQNKDYTENLQYNHAPIRDEDIFRPLSTSEDQTATSSSSTLNRYSRETFRKRSVSLEAPIANGVENVKKTSKNLKPEGSTPDSPCDGRSFASSDDITRDQSEGNWNDSQITVLPLPPLPNTMPM